jgi:hypothetical protein
MLLNKKKNKTSHISAWRKIYRLFRIVVQNMEQMNVYVKYKYTR